LTCFTVLAALVCGCSQSPPGDPNVRTYTPEQIHHMKAHDPETYEKLKAEGKVE
jgi:hypothetical protein